MNLRRYLVPLFLLAACTGWAAVIYKWTDAQGVVHYADQPVPGAQKIITSTETMNTMHAQAPAADTAPPQPPGPSALAYSVFSIASPAPEQTFINEPVPVQLRLVPSLQSTHTLNWYLNGKLLEDRLNAVNFTMTELPRGAYTLVAKILDPATEQSVSSGTVAFYVQHPSKLMPQHKRP